MKIVLVTFEAGYLAQKYVKETSLPWTLLVDDTRETYGNYGMLHASFWDIWGPGSWWAYIMEIMKGAKLKRSEGDIFQRGGDVLIGPDGTVRLHHVGVGPGDRPAVETLMGTIDSG